MRDRESRERKGMTGREKKEEMHKVVGWNYAETRFEAQQSWSDSSIQ